MFKIYKHHGNRTSDAPYEYWQYPPCKCYRRGHNHYPFPRSAIDNMANDDENL